MALISKQVTNVTRCGEAVFRSWRTRVDAVSEHASGIWGSFRVPARVPPPGQWGVRTWHQTTCYGRSAIHLLLWSQLRYLRYQLGLSELHQEGKLESRKHQQKVLIRVAFVCR